MPSVFAALGRLWVATTSRPPRLHPGMDTGSWRPWERDGSGEPPVTERISAYGPHCGAAPDATPAPTEGLGVPAEPPGEDAGDLCGEEPAGPVRPPAAGNHCLNRLPVHRSVFVAGFRGQGGRQAAVSEPTVRIGYAPKRPAFLLASRSRLRGRHLIPWRVIVNGHSRTLRARAGYCPDVATPACRSRNAGSFQAGSASSNFPPSGLVGAASGNTSREPATVMPGSAGAECACRGGRAVVQRSVHDLASLQYQRMSAHAWPPSGTRKARGSAMLHMAHSATSSGRGICCVPAGGSASAR
jgi:hypothetical protein